MCSSDLEYTVLETQSQKVTDWDQLHVPHVSINKEVQPDFPEESGGSFDIYGFDFISKIINWYAGNPDILEENLYPKSFYLTDQSVEVRTKDETVITFDLSIDFSIQIQRLVAIVDDSKLKGKELKLVNVGYEKPYGEYK